MKKLNNEELEIVSGGVASVDLDMIQFNPIFEKEGHPELIEPKNVPLPNIKPYIQPDLDPSEIRRISTLIEG